VRVLAAVFVFGLFATVARAQTQPPPSPAPAARPAVTVVRVQTPPRLDDYLEGGSHPGAAVTDFRQRRPKDLDPITERTTAYLSYDATQLYVAFVCEMSNAAQIRAHMSKRESVFSDDIIGVLIDTFKDQQRAYMFFTNPLGIQADGVTAATTGDDMNFDTQWSSEGKLTSSGYVVLVGIPFKSLRFPVTTAPQSWGLALMRTIPGKDEQAFWPGITERLNSFVAQFGEANGLEGVSPGRNLQLIPYATVARARFLDAPQARYTTDTDRRGGLDVKTVVRDAMTLDFTLNPDFSQVESDDPQVTVNQRFEVFFPEKRPFFLENSDYFTDTPQNLFFSRRIADPRFGGRMTGKIGRWAFGAVVADDRAPGRAADPGSPGSGDGTLDGVFRLRHDFHNQSRLGALVTARSFGSSNNTVAAADGRLRLGPKWFLDAQTIHSTMTTLDGATLSGTSTNLGVSRSGRLFQYSLNYVDASPDFRTQLGFVPRLDYRQATEYFQLRWFPASGPIINFGPNSFVQATWNYAGDLQDWVVRLPFSVQFKGQTYLFGRHAFISETIEGQQFRQHEDVVQFGSDYLKWLSVNVSLAAGTRPNYYPANGLAPFLADFTDVFLGLTVQPASALRIDETYFYSGLAARADSPYRGSIFKNPLLRSRVNYQFSREWSLRGIVDYSSLTPSPSLVALDRTRHAGYDLLLTWLPHPGTAFYLGYTDGYDNQRLDSQEGVVPTADALASTGRQLFAKLSWLFRF